MPECKIGSGEIVSLEDPRLSDPSCVIEPGAVIRPPHSLEMGAAPKVARKKPKVIEEPVPEPVAEVVPEPEPVVEAPVPKPVVQKRAVTTEAAEVPVPVQEEGLTSSEVAAGAAVLGVAAVGAAAATSASGGIAAVQVKLVSMLGSKAAAATAAAVTAGTIVAVKALESKMGKLEQDMTRAKEEVGGAASSIKRIDELLDRLGDDGDDKLDPPV